MSSELSDVAVALPYGSGFGWGNCGTELTKWLTSMGAVSVVNNDPCIEYFHDKTVLQAISGREFGYTANVMGWHQAGYGFIEDDIIGRKNAKLAQRLWDTVICGSQWMTDWMMEEGAFVNVFTCVQGVDPQIFHYREPKNLDTPFTIGSFGKMEFRKGQDIVIKAFGLFQEKHPEVQLLYAWNNPWPQLIQQMAAEPGLKCDMRQVGLDLNLSGTTPVFHNLGKPGTFHSVVGGPMTMRDAMETCDVALFPSRCEAGQGLMMQECLAIGTPCITTNGTGHKDITGRIDYPCKELNLNGGKTFVYKQGDLEVGNWYEACIDEAVAKLELVYNQREEYRKRRKAISDWGMQWTWSRSADKMAAILKGI